MRAIDTCACATSAITFGIYITVIGFGNVITSLFALRILKESAPTGLENWHPLLAPFAGVFAFEAVLGKTNITVFDKGVLTIQDHWDLGASQRWRRRPKPTSRTLKALELATKEPLRAASIVAQIAAGTP